MSDDEFAALATLYLEPQYQAMAESPHATLDLLPLLKAVEAAERARMANHTQARLAEQAARLYAERDAEVAAERERCITAAEDAYLAGRGAKGCIDAIRALCGPSVEFSGVPAGHSSNHPAGEGT